MALGVGIDQAGYDETPRGFDFSGVLGHRHARGGDLTNDVALDQNVRVVRPMAGNVEQPSTTDDLKMRCGH